MDGYVHSIHLYTSAYAHASLFSEGLVVHIIHGTGHIVCNLSLQLRLEEGHVVGFACGVSTSDSSDYESIHRYVSHKLVGHLVATFAGTLHVLAANVHHLPTVLASSC